MKITPMLAAIVLASVTSAQAWAHHASPQSLVDLHTPTWLQLVAGDPAAKQEFEGAHETMVKNMMVTLTGDTDRDFAAQMIPHHQGAVDMAQIELRYGKDPMLRIMAEDIITAQKKEIAEFQSWLASHPQE